MRLILCCLLAVAACGGDGGTGDDGINVSDAPSSSDAFPSSDGPSQQSGLTVTWAAQPAIPGSFATNVVIDSVKLKIARLEVIGDTGSTTNTTTTDFDAIWSMTGGPFPIPFFFAQPGLYSRVSLQIDGKLMAPSYEVTGSVLIGSTNEMFTITDTAALPVDVSGYSVALMAGQAEDVPIRVDMQPVINAVDFAMLPVIAGKRTMTQNTAGIAAVRAALQSSTFLR